ncbi:DUF6134 family protein [Chryseobacterium proteolyticum]|uniref:DUF6134 family protein n=1 Tax=Chryseobacterium proteolyticum TaxID=118127 RepID=UPI0039834BD3
MKTYFISALLLIMLCSGMVSGQNNVQYYDVIHRDQLVGSTVVKKVGNDQNFTITLSFSADIDFLIKRVVITGREYARFENRVLKSGSVYRKVNDKVKTDNTIKHLGSYYKVQDGEKSHTLAIEEIRDNMLSLFFSEPDRINTVYADNQQKLVSIAEAAPKKYVVPGKNDSSSTYIFQNGQCSSVILKSKLVTLILKRR